jgi:hypothetical protein
MDKLEIKQGSFIQQTQYFIPVEIDLSEQTNYELKNIYTNSRDEYFYW